MRILDLDLDFFVRDVAYYMDLASSERLDADDFPAWSLTEAMEFLEVRCGLAGKLPGFVVERHAEMFWRWRDAIADARLATPMSVVHVDAHADLGCGDAGYVQLMSELLFRPVEYRTQPYEDDGYGMGDGNWLAYAVGCRWVADLTYVHNAVGSSDLLALHMENFDMSANLQLKAIDRDTLMDAVWDMKHPVAENLEPVVPFECLPWYQWDDHEPFDVVCLCRSPSFTPATADVIFDEIRDRFIDESAFS